MMNERFSEIYQASFSTYEAGVGFDTKLVARFDLEKYSKMLIQECMNICEVEKSDYIKHRKGAWDFSEKNIYAEGEAACDTIKIKMKHRFGIK